MALQSKLFRGDAKLEAAAVSDAAHIVQGAKGDHVRKIQLALNQLDGTDLDADGIYGAATAAAVLAYKQKRNIVNVSYQTQADNIVGKMTVAALDLELLSQQVAPFGATRLLPVHPLARHPSQRQAVLPEKGVLRVEALAGDPASAGGPTLDIAAPATAVPQIQLRTNQLGTFIVVNGIGKRLVVRQSWIGLVFDPAKPEDHQAGSVAVTQSPQVLNIRARDPGRTEIVILGTAAQPLGEIGMILSVLPNVFTEVQTFFHFLDGPAGIKTARAPADLDAILKTMNTVYNDQASMTFVKNGVNPSLKIAGLGGGLAGVRVNRNGASADTDAIKARRQASILFNVFFVGTFLLGNLDGDTPDFLAFTSRPPDDDKPLRCCLCRDPQKSDPPGIDPGKTLAHEAGHALGEDDDEKDSASLMFFSQSRQRETVITPLMAQRMLASFKKFPP